MIHVPKAQEVFTEGGEYQVDHDGDAWDGYLARGLDQLVWWAQAASNQRTAAGSPSKAFLSTPAQRNAPDK